MAKFIVKGGRPLFGEVQVAGAKNAASKMFVASLLTAERCIFKSVPAIGELEIVKELLANIGTEIDVAGPTASVATPVIKNNRVTQLSRKNRIPILALGPLLARTGEAEVPVLGGDKIGARPVDIHLDGLKQLGAEITSDENFFYASAPQGLKGATITLRYPSVGATENLILASVLAKGRTTIHNAAVEPEIMDIILLLQKMGAIIGLGSDRTIFIEGVEKLHGARHRILPDRNEAVSFACLGLASPGNEVKVKYAVQKDLITFLNAVRKIGGEYRIEDDGIVFYRTKDLIANELETDTHPGFMTDWQQPFLILLTQANGTSVIHETVYDDRFGYTAELNAMGANITVFSKCLGELVCRFNGQGHPHSAVVSGPTPLRGTTLKVRDLRAGMAHLIAALIADGETIIDGIEEIDRGYADLDERLINLGANITRSV